MSEWITDPDGIGYPDWSSDTRYVQYWSGSKIKRIKLGDSRPENLFSIKGLTLHTNPELGPWNDDAHDGSRMFLRELSRQDIYLLDVDFQ